MVGKLGYEPMTALLRNMVSTAWVKIILVRVFKGHVKPNKISQKWDLNPECSGLSMNATHMPQDKTLFASFLLSFVGLGKKENKLLYILNYRDSN